MSRTSPVLDSRARERLICYNPLFGKLMLTSAQQPLEVRVRDLSGAGIGFQADRPVPVGQDVVVRLSKSSAGSVIRFNARIVHCQQTSEQSWHIGCQLTEHALDAILDYLVS
jgi:hypothetical protein